MRLLEVEALVALAEHCRRYPSPDVETWHRAVLRGVGAHAGASRSLLPEVVPRDTAVALLALLRCFNKDQQEALLPLFYSKEGQGFSSEKVVVLDSLMALAVFACSGNLQDRLHLAFWSLDREDAGYLVVGQLLRAVDSLLTVAAAARLFVPSLLQQHSAKGGQGGGGRGDSTAASRELLQRVVLEAHAELSLRVSNRLPEPQVFQLIMLSVQRMTHALVQAAIGPSSNPAASGLYAPPHGPHTTINIGGGSLNRDARTPSGGSIGSESIQNAGTPRLVSSVARVSPSSSREASLPPSTPHMSSLSPSPGPLSPVGRHPSMASLVRAAPGTHGGVTSTRTFAMGTTVGTTVSVTTGVEGGPGAQAVQGGAMYSRVSYVSSVYSWAAQGVAWYWQQPSRLSQANGSSTGGQGGGGGGEGAQGTAGSAGATSGMMTSRSSLRLWPFYGRTSTSQAGVGVPQGQGQGQGHASVAGPASPQQLVRNTSLGAPVTPVRSRRLEQVQSFNTIGSVSTPEQLSPAPTAREADMEAALHLASQAAGVGPWAAGHSELLVMPVLTGGGHGEGQEGGGGPNSPGAWGRGARSSMPAMGTAGGMAGGGDTPPTGGFAGGLDGIVMGGRLNEAGAAGPEGAGLYSIRWPSRNAGKAAAGDTRTSAGSALVRASAPPVHPATDGSSHPPPSSSTALKSPALGGGMGAAGGSTATRSQADLGPGAPSSPQWRSNALSHDLDPSRNGSGSAPTGSIGPSISISLGPMPASTLTSSPGGPYKVESPTFDGDRLSSLEPPTSIEAAVARAQTAQKAAAHAQRINSSAQQAAPTPRATSPPTPTAVSTGGALRQTIRNSLQAAAVKVVLNCSVCLLAVMSLGLLDAALVVWVCRGNGYSLELSLAIVGGVDLGVMLILLGMMFFRQWMNTRAAQRAASAAGQEGGGSGNAFDGILSLVLNPVLRMLGGPVPTTRGGVDGDAAAGQAPWTAKLRTVWTTIGKVAGFDAQPGAQGERVHPNDQSNREAGRRAYSLDSIGEEDRNQNDPSVVRFRMRSPAMPAPTGPFAPSQVALRQAYGDAFDAR